MLDQSESIDVDSLQPPQISEDKTVKIIDFGCGFQERARQCWINYGLLDAMEGQFPGRRLEITGLELWWENQYDFSFEGGHFRGTIENKDLPQQVEGVIWRYPNPWDIIEGRNNQMLAKDGVLADISKIIRERLIPGGCLFFETDLAPTTEPDFDSELQKLGLEKVNPFKTTAPFYEHTFGSKYMKKAA